MERYLFKNYRIRPFHQKSFVGQSDYYVVADLFQAENPNKMLDVIAYWGTEDEVEIMKSITDSKPLANKFNEPFFGEYRYVPSKTPLYRIFKDEDAYLGRCSENQIGEIVCKPNGDVWIFNNIKVFCRINKDYIRFETYRKYRKLPYKNPCQRYQCYWEPDYRVKYQKKHFYKEVEFTKGLPF